MRRRVGSLIDEISEEIDVNSSEKIKNDVSGKQHIHDWFKVTRQIAAFSFRKEVIIQCHTAYGVV